MCGSFIERWSFLNIGRNKFIQIDDILAHRTNPVDFSIIVGVHVHIYYEKLPCMSKDESFKFSYTMDVFDCLVEVSIIGTFYWALIFECYVDVMHKCHHNPTYLNLYPHEVV